MEVVGNVLPFKTNNYVVEQLIDWNNIPNDPILWAFLVAQTVKNLPAMQETWVRTLGQKGL